MNYSIIIISSSFNNSLYDIFKQNAIKFSSSMYLFMIISVDTREISDRVAIVSVEESLANVMGRVSVSVHKKSLIIK